MMDANIKYHPDGPHFLVAIPDVPRYFCVSIIYAMIAMHAIINQQKN